MVAKHAKMIYGCHRSHLGLCNYVAWYIAAAINSRRCFSIVSAYFIRHRRRPSIRRLFSAHTFYSLLTVALLIKIIVIAHAILILTSIIMTLDRNSRKNLKVLSKWTQGVQTINEETLPDGPAHLYITSSIWSIYAKKSLWDILSMSSLFRTQNHEATYAQLYFLLLGSGLSEGEVRKPSGTQFTR